MPAKSKTFVPPPQEPASAPAKPEGSAQLREKYLANVRNAILPGSTHPTPETLAAILKALGVKSGVLTGEEAREITRIQAEYDETHARLSECGHGVAKREFHAQRTGDLDSDIPTRESLETQSRIRRHAIKTKLRELRAEANALATRAWLRVGVVCQQFAAERMESEKTEAAQWGLPWVPSPVLLAALSVAENAQAYGDAVAGLPPIQRTAGLTGIK